MRTTKVVVLLTVFAIAAACSNRTILEDQEGYEKSLIDSGLTPLNEQQITTLHSDMTFYLRFQKSGIDWVEYYGQNGVAAILVTADYPQQGLKKGDVANGSWWTEGNKFCVDYGRFGLSKPVCLRVYKKSEKLVLYIRTEDLRHGVAGSLTSFTTDIRKGNIENYPPSN